MADTTKTTAPADTAETVAKPRGKQIAATFSEEELAHIHEAQFHKRQLKATDLVRAAVLAFIADVPKPE